MGNSSSSGRGHHEETVDFGYLTPQGIYTGPRDWNQAIVTQLIIDRKLAPFYRPLEDYDESWDDTQITAAMKEPQQAENAEAESTITRAEASSIHSSSSRTHHKRPSTTTRELPQHPEAAVYRGAAECPICFLYYPSNINHSRCCDQAICTECFVQIKRADPTTTHLVSEPASCPYCVQENFGVVYTPPSWRAGIGSEGWTPPVWTDLAKAPQDSPSPAAAMKRRRKSFGADSPEVVTIDQIRPDWEAKLAAVRATVARRANRRIIMRQVGDRLIPVGISSGRVHALPAEEGQGESGEAAGATAERGSRRSRRRQQSQELNQYLGQMGLGGQDLEELMIMEAMRLSLIDHEDQQRKQRDEEEKKKREGGGQASAGDSSATGSSAGPTTSSNDVPTLPPLVFADSSDSTGSRGAHRSSSSLSGLSARLSPDRSSPGRRSPSPIGALGAALMSATSTVTAVASPPAERTNSITTGSDSSASIPQVASADTEQSSASLRSEIPAPDRPVAVTSPRVIVTDAPEDGTAANVEASATEESSTALGLGHPSSVPPLSQRTTSFASSMLSEATENGETYDTLPSSPSSSSSSLSQKPLLDSSISGPAGASHAAIVNGDNSSSVATTSDDP